MRKRSSIPATMATALLLTVSMVLFWSGCGKEEGSPVAPLGQLPGLHQSDPLEDVQSTIPEVSGDPLVSDEQVKELCERLRVAGSVAEAQAIWDALSKEQQAAVTEALRVVRVVTERSEAPAATAGSDPRGLSHRYVSYYVYGLTTIGTRAWEYGEWVDWDYDGRYVYNAQSGTWHVTYYLVWTYDKEYREIHGADGWMAYYAYGKGQFTQHLWPGGPPIAGRIPYVGIMARGNGTCTPTMGCYNGWW